MYVAKHYVRVNNVIYTAGEVIEKIDPEKRDRLLRIGAIEEIPVDHTNKTEKAPKSAAAVKPEPENETEPEVPQIDITEGIVDKPKSKKRSSKK